MTVHISQLEDKYFSSWIDMRMQLWTKNSRAELEAQGRLIWQTGKLDGYAHVSNYAVAIAVADNAVIGFVEYALRSWVDTAKSSPVAFLEGLYVRPEFRQQGVAKKLLEHVESWAKEKGCIEIGSDTWPANQPSIEMHGKLGFRPVRPLITFLKPL